MCLHVLFPSRCLNVRHTVILSGFNTANRTTVIKEVQLRKRIDMAEVWYSAAHQVQSCHDSVSDSCSEKKH